MIPPPDSFRDRSQAAVDSLIAFLNSPDASSRTQWLFGGQPGANILEQYDKSVSREMPRRVINPSVSAMRVKGREILLVLFKDHQQRSWSAPFEWDRGTYRLHWEAMTGYGEIPWQTFRDKKPPGRYRMRANLFLPAAPFQTSPLEDMAVISLTHPELPVPMTALIPRTSELFSQLETLGPSGDFPAVIEIEWKPSQESIGPTITGLVHRDWLR
ncbi:MAG: hypothetical protein QM680_07820 [Luteolibacter sp.]